MSIFNPATAPCPNCGHEVQLNLVASVNADRRTDLRDDILAGEFQVQTCPNCGNRFRILPQMTYLDIGRHQWILVQPSEAIAQWQELETVANDAFSLAFGAASPPAAQAIGRGLHPRVIFGWAALREKLLCGEHGLDDIELELLKMAVIRDVNGAGTDVESETPAASAAVEEAPPETIEGPDGGDAEAGVPSAPKVEAVRPGPVETGAVEPGSLLSDDNELRLVDVEGGDLVLAWITARTEAVESTLRVPRDVYDDIAGDELWQPLRDEFAGARYVDVNRLLV